MRFLNAVLAVLVCLTLSAASTAQTNRKPGLWDLTTTMTWQQSPFAPGATPQAAPHTVAVCLTQQQIDKYGAITPSSHPGCEIVNIVKNSTGMTADMVCTGGMSGKAALQSSLTDSDHATGSMHFVGSMRMGASSKPIEWTTHSSSVFKSPDCGNVKPLTAPNK